MVLGEMSLQSGLLKVGSLTARPLLPMDNVAKSVLLPAENNRDFVDIPTEVLDMIQIIFHSAQINAAFRALGVD